MHEPITPAPLRHHNDRPQGITIDTIIIHSMYAPNASSPFDPLTCIHLLDTHGVAAHYVIGRSGEVFQCVDEGKRAWHAGESMMPFPTDRRPDVNDFSIGVELIGSKRSAFTVQQYSALGGLIVSIASRHPISKVVGHEHIAPNRKQDPGPLFDWSFLKERFGETIRFVEDV